jgi:hypothetical protein
MDAAWRLTKSGKPGAWPDSISETVELCNVGKSTVNRMRQTWTTLHSGQHSYTEKLEDISWREAQRKIKGEKREEFDYDSWLEERAHNLAKDIDRAKLRLTTSPEVTALALEMLDPGLPEALMAYWAPPRPFDPHARADDDDWDDEDGGAPPF